MGEVEAKVGEIFLKLEEVLEVEDLVEGTGAVEVAHLAVGGVEGAGHVHDLCAEGGHAGAAADPDHFRELRVES